MPPDSAAAPRRSVVLRAWHGELGLYRSAYGLGGVGLAVVSLLGDVVLIGLPPGGRVPAWLFETAIDLAELAFAWFICVATWRAALRGRPDGRPYGTISAGVALALVGLQLAIMIAWTLLSLLGSSPDASDAVLRVLIKAMGGDPAGLDQLLHVMNYQPR